MKNSIALIIIVTLFQFISYSQNIPLEKENLKTLSGKVVDASTKEPLEFATVSIFEINKKKQTNEITTDKKGSFTIENIKSGSYFITVNLLGYTKFIKKDIEIRSENINNLPLVILLEKNINTLEVVTITSKQHTIENKIDKIVYNLDKDVTSQGGVATDALKKIPGVTVDIDGNVELLGNSSIQFLIDGKPSILFGNSVSDALQSIPNSQIQSIEVITSPTAKYDSSGSGGIINIILKKNKAQGFNGNINLAVGTRLENGSLNLGWKKNNFSLNAFYSGNAQLKAVTPVGMNRFSVNHFDKSKTQLLQEGDVDYNRNSYSTGLGMDWAISGKDNLSATVALQHLASRNTGDTDQYMAKWDSFGTLLSEANSWLISDNQSDVNTLDNSLAYTKKFKKENQELIISYSGSFGKNNTFYDQTQQNNPTSPPFSGANSLNLGNENEVQIGFDYAQPINKDFLLETGYKTIFQSIISNADVFVLEPNTGDYTKDSQQSYASDYKRNIYSGYVATSFSLFKYLDVKAGMRYEYTKSKATYSNVKTVAIPNYSNPAPSLIVSHTFPAKQTLKFTYAYRLERPDFRDLNPFLNLSDPHTITTGNPNLQPEIGHNYQLGYNKVFENGANINVVVYQQINKPDIKPYTTYYPFYEIGGSTYTDVSVSSRANIDHEIKTGLNIALSVPAGKKFNLRSNMLFYNRNIKNSYATPVVTNTFSYRLNLNVSYQFNKGFIGEVFGNYNSSMIWQGKRPSVFSYTMAIRKQFLNNKASLGFITVDPFNKYIIQKTTLIAEDVVAKSYRNIPYRSFGVSFTYKFGKLKFGKQKEEENILYTTPPVEN
jgi:ferric enterobactin receptor